MYIKNGQLHVGLNEIPTSHCTTFHDPRLMAKDDNEPTDYQYAVAELRTWEADLEDREAKLAAIRQRCRELLSTL